jgi:hypothetical protein
VQDGSRAPHEQREMERGGGKQPPRWCLDAPQGRRLLVKGNVVRVHARRRRWRSIRHDVCAPGEVASRSINVYPMYPALARRVRRGGCVWISHQHRVEVACGGGTSASCFSCAWNMPGLFSCQGVAKLEMRDGWGVRGQKTITLLHGRSQYWPQKEAATQYGHPSPTIVFDRRFWF